MATVLHCYTLPVSHFNTVALLHIFIVTLLRCETISLEHRYALTLVRPFAVTLNFWHPCAFTILHDSSVTLSSPCLQFYTSALLHLCSYTFALFFSSCELLHSWHTLYSFSSYTLHLFTSLHAVCLYLSTSRLAPLHTSVLPPSCTSALLHRNARTLLHAYAFTCWYYACTFLHLCSSTLTRVLFHTFAL